MSGCFAIRMLGVANRHRCVEITCRCRFQSSDNTTQYTPVDKCWCARSRRLPRSCAGCGRRVYGWRCRQRFRMQAGIGQHRVTLGKLNNGEVPSLSAWAMEQAASSAWGRSHGRDQAGWLDAAPALRLPQSDPSLPRRNNGEAWRSPATMYNRLRSEPHLTRPRYRPSEQVARCGGKA